MKFFRGWPFGHSQVMPGTEADRIRSKLDSALTSIFTEDGKRTVLFYMSNSFGLTLEQASTDPARLEDALTKLLGEIGWMVVKRRILEQFWERSIEMREIAVVENASLQDAFGFVRGLRSILPFRRFP